MAEAQTILRQGRGAPLPIDAALQSGLLDRAYAHAKALAEA